MTNLTERKMKKYVIYLWCGAGYVLTPFETMAANEYEALDNVVTELVNTGDNAFYCELDDEFINENLNEFDECEGWMYWDATMSGASRPVYLRSENMRIEVK